jgi:hypothetical protein
MMPERIEVALDSPAWRWAAGDVLPGEHLGRPAIAFGGSADLVALVDGVQLTDGLIEVDVALTGERAFHGVVWRARDRSNYESFYVRPHQVRNPDSVQYNPVLNDVASWKLYHDQGFWAAVDFPMAAWFTIRVVFAGTRAEMFVGDMAVPALEATELKMPVAAGGIGLQVGGPGLYVSRFAYARTAPTFVGAGTRTSARVDGIVPAWLVSDAFAEPPSPPAQVGTDALAGRRWTRLEAEPSGLVNLATATGIDDGRNTVWARASIHSDRARTVPMQLGFSDRAVAYLNGVALFRADDTYRSRDYRFLGSIGWYDTLYLALAEGANDLLIAVSESFGGWGVQARFDDLDGLRLDVD